MSGKNSEALLVLLNIKPDDVHRACERYANHDPDKQEQRRVDSEGHIQRPDQLIEIAPVVNPASKEDGALRTGLLFYQDRKIGTECQLDYITKWQVQLTDDAGPETVNKTLAALSSVRTTTCGSDEEEEAVFDALVQAISHSRWQDSPYRLLVLIGDAGPHPPGDVKNPMRYDLADILKLADQHSVRILAMQIRHDPYQDVSAFQSLAAGPRDDLKGRFMAVPPAPKAIRETLNRALWAEWIERAR